MDIFGSVTQTVAFFKMRFVMIKRYDDEMVENKDGDWVKYDDIVHAVESWIAVSNTMPERNAVLRKFLKWVLRGGK